jgi:hypothetical protein
MPRPLCQIQMAHDVLWQVVMREIDIGLSEEALRGARMQLSVLCWALGHGPEEQVELIQESTDLAFGEVLRLVMDKLEAKGFRLKESPVPFVRRPPGHG